MQTIVWSTLYVQFFSPVQDGDRLEFGGLKFRTMLTQGHTTGHMVYILDGSPYGVPDSVFSGDLLFLAGCGQCWGHCGHAMAPSFFPSLYLYFLLSFFFFLFSFLFLWDIINLKIHTINNSIITFSQTKYERMFCSSSPKVLCPWSRWRFIIPLSYAWFCLGNIFQRVQVNFPWVYQQWLGLLNCW